MHARALDGPDSVLDSDDEGYVLGMTPAQQAAQVVRNKAAHIAAAAAAAPGTTAATQVAQALRPFPNVGREHLAVTRRWLKN